MLGPIAGRRLTCCCTLSVQPSTRYLIPSLAAHLRTERCWTRRASDWSTYKWLRRRKQHRRDTLTTTAVLSMAKTYMMFQWYSADSVLGRHWRIAALEQRAALCSDYDTRLLQQLSLNIRRAHLPVDCVGYDRLGSRMLWTEI